jgi:hypothetical protein
VLPLLVLSSSQGQGSCLLLLPLVLSALQEPE